MKGYTKAKTKDKCTIADYNKVFAFVFWNIPLFNFANPQHC